MGILLQLFMRNVLKIKNALLWFLLKQLMDIVLEVTLAKFWPSNHLKEDEKSFLFSLDLKSKYKCINFNEAIFSNGCYVFSFGCNLYIYNNCTKNKESYLNSPYSYEIPRNYEMNGGEDKFTVKSYEIYEVEY